MNNFHWIVSFTLLFSLANLQAQEDNNGAILLDPETGQALCRIGGQVGQNFIPDSLIDQIGQIQDLEECSGQQILTAAIEGETETVQMAAPSLNAIGLLGPIAGCSIGVLNHVQYKNSFQIRFTKPRRKIFATILGVATVWGVIKIYFATTRSALQIPFLVSTISGSLLCQVITEVSPETQDNP